MEKMSISVQCMSKQAYVSNLLVFAISAMILGLGTACFVKADLGADALSTFALGIEHYLPIRVDQIIFVIMYGMMFVTLLLDRKKLGFASFLYPFISSTVMSIALTFLPAFEMLWIRYALVVSGVILMALSIAIGAQTKVGYNPYDSLAFSMMERWSLSYAKVRWMLDGGYLLFGILLGGTLGMGTIIVLATLGSCADYFLKFSKCLLQTLQHANKEGGQQYE